MLPLFVARLMSLFILIAALGSRIMRRRTPFPVIPLVLAHGVAFRPKPKQIATGVAVFLLGIIFLETGRKAFLGGALQSRRMR